jgi:hypothetical protein
MSARNLLLLFVSMCPACTWWSSQENVLITSEPAGARIAVDGTDTGKTTPSRIQIGGNFGRDHTVELTKKGFRPAQRRLYQFTEGYSSKWIDGADDPVLLPLPLFWTAGDFVFPFGVRGALLPAELYVRLEREDAPKLGFEVLAEKRAAAAGTSAGTTNAP